MFRRGAALAVVRRREAGGRRGRTWQSGHRALTCSHAAMHSCDARGFGARQRMASTPGAPRRRRAQQAAEGGCGPRPPRLVEVVAARKLPQERRRHWHVLRRRGACGAEGRSGPVRADLRGAVAAAQAQRAPQPVASRGRVRRRAGRRTLEAAEADGAGVRAAGGHGAPAGLTPRLAGREERGGGWGGNQGELGGRDGGARHTRLGAGGARLSGVVSP